jgi:ABC-type multidrug transport system fused ATPase/permease subunit
MRLPLRQYWALFAAYLAPQRGRMLLLGLALFGAIGAQLLAPQVLRVFVDAAVGAAAAGALLRAAALFLGLALLTQALGMTATYLGESVGWRATNALRIDLARHCLELDLAFHNARTPGELIERVDGDVTALARFFSRFIIEVLGNLLLLLGVVAVLAWQDWRLGLGAAGFVLLSLAVLTWLRARAVPAVVAWREQSAQVYGFLGEQLAGTEDLRANGATGYVLRRFLLLLRPWLATYHRARFGATTLWGASVGLFALGNAVALGLSAYLWAQGAISIGAIFAVFYYINQLNDPIDRLRTELEELQRAEAGIQRIGELRSARSTLPPGGATPLPAGPLSVQLEGLSFWYEHQQTGRQAGKATRSATGDRLASRSPGLSIARPPPAAVLNNITLHLRPGETLGLLGRTGSGKSTLARLLLGLYAPQAGRITLGGVDLADTPRRDLPRYVGMVTQEVQIFQGSVRENLTFFDPLIADAELHETLTLLGLDRWLARLPAGLDTPIGANGVGLSAGEAQMLAFARVFLKNPGLVILDEASARLDPATEALLTTAMERLFAGRSAIVIAHRLQTVLRADQILILEQGRIAEYGSRAALQADPQSMFSRLLRLGLAEVIE